MTFSVLRDAGWSQLTSAAQQPCLLYGPRHQSGRKRRLNKQLPRWKRKRPECMLAQAPEECHNPSWWHRDASALPQCAPLFASPCKTGCASSRCRSHRLCSALPVIIWVKNSSLIQSVLQEALWEELAWAPDAARKSLASAMVSPEEPLYQQLDWLMLYGSRAPPVALLLTTTLIFTYQLWYVAATLVLEGVVFASAKACSWNNLRLNFLKTTLIMYDGLVWLKTVQNIFLFNSTNM